MLPVMAREREKKKENYFWMKASVFRGHQTYRFKYPILFRIPGRQRRKRKEGVITKGEKKKLERKTWNTKGPYGIFLINSLSP